MRLTLLISGAAALLASSGLACAEPMAPDEVVATIRALQQRVEALEARSRKDRSDADAARAELRAVKLGNRRVVAAARVDAPVAPIALARPIAPPSSSFDGFYVAGEGGYQFAPQKQQQSYFYTNPQLAAAPGGTVGISFGYNQTFGDLLLGFEGRGRKEFSQSTDFFQQSSPYTVTFPFFLSSSSSVIRPPGRYPLNNIGDFGLTYGFATRDIARREYGGDISVRAGLIFGETLIYGRLGAGLDAISRVTTTDASANSTCVAPTGYEDVSFSGTFDYATGCTSISRGGITKTVVQKTQPYAILGAGIEQNFGPMFARLEGSLLNHMPAFGNSYFGSGYYITTEITGAIGYRF